MEHDFWHNRWAEQRIGFHQQTINSYLKTFFQQLELNDGEQVFVPLCGKSSDMVWLREQDCEVLGVELSDTACAAFFAENAIDVVGVIEGAFTVREVDSIRLMGGDFFQLTAQALKKVAAVYDRAALVALPRHMRAQYAHRLSALLPPGVKMLLITLEFEGEQGPPFSVTPEEVDALFSARFELKRLHEVQLSDPRDAGRTEVVWLLTDKSCG
ncbi:MAG: thiopurine S-methyltransferase [Neptuniibacter pectenicola]|jgi:thiopurine S-methyltransferase|uniref:thiopurine S-methyltransferase n=1 Tax=Neptuniibacter pectenicola TaxID=1806669 RepID=UPI003AE51A89